MTGKLHCYNRGCGQQFDPDQNHEESCRHHPGVPVFHDAYKGWSCCNKKSVDFTEFLNIKGCTLSMHSNVKPPEPEKSEKETEIEEPSIPVPLNKEVHLERPPLETPLVTLTPKISPSFQAQMDSLPKSEVKQITNIIEEISIGTKCKNGGCSVEFTGPETNFTECIHHPGVPIFHEGMKYWSCCQKKTSDFTAFMNQVGCETGKHCWVKDSGAQTVKCRWDWHQTARDVVVSVYAKLYDYKKSFVKINPIRLVVELVFPQQSNNKFVIDLELKGIVKVGEATVNMMGTKVEIVLPKAEPGSWPRLEVPPKVTATPKSAPKVEEDGDSDVDLDDVTGLAPIKEVTNNPSEPGTSQ